jgi:transposase, IS30 family
MKPYKHFTEDERRVIQKMYYSGVKKSKIASYMQRHPSSIFREMNRNKTHGYNAADAQNKSESRRWQKESKLRTNGLLRMIVVDLLREKNSPEVIAFYLQKYFPFCAVSHETIYRWLYDRSEQGGYTFVTLLFTRRRSRQKRANTYKNRAKDTSKKNIRLRPEEANKRSEYGHLEGDLIIGKEHSGYLLTLVDRKAKYLWSVSLPSKDEETTLRGFVEVLDHLPKGFVRSITLDNGTEFGAHKLIEQALSCPVFFADPYSSWQRGLNEHLNGRLRHYFPKKRNFSDLTDDEVSCAVSSINNRPRKSLGWVSPSEILDPHLVALQH